MKLNLFIFCICLLLSPGASSAQDFLSSQQPNTIYIGGIAINSNNRLTQEEFDKDMPAALRTNIIRRTLENRQEITIYTHAPSNGPEQAPITSVEFIDLSCIHCYETFQEWEDILEPYIEKGLVRRIYVHAPLDPYETTNSAAFYARIAQLQGFFWKYMDLLFENDMTATNAFSKVLLNLGVERKELRNIIRNNARQIYKEIDSDAVLSKEMAQNGTTYFINGVKIGQNITFEQLPLFLEYELKLHNRKYGDE